MFFCHILRARARVHPADSISPEQSGRITSCHLCLTFETLFLGREKKKVMGSQNLSCPVPLPALSYRVQAIEASLQALLSHDTPLLLAPGQQGTDLLRGTLKVSVGQSQGHNPSLPHPQGWSFGPETQDLKFPFRVCPGDAHVD